MGAAADCELIGGGLLGQPVNSLTTMAFVVAGIVVARQPTLRWPGAALVATGLGSFLFHGPMPGTAEWVHDMTLSWLIVLIASIGQPWEGWTRLPGLVALGLLFALAPAAADPVAVGLTVIAVVLLLMRDRSLATLGPLGLLAATAILGRLGATGGPMCDPASLWQPHGLWHVGAALAVTWYLLARYETVPQPT